MTFARLPWLDPKSISTFTSFDTWVLNRRSSCKNQYQRARALIACLHQVEPEQSDQFKKINGHMTGFSYDGHVISGESHLLVVALHVGQLLLQTFKLQFEITSGEAQAFFESSETIDISLRIPPHGHLHIMPECSVFHINLFFQSLYNVPFINNYTQIQKLDSVEPTCFWSLPQPSGRCQSAEWCSGSQCISSGSAKWTLLLCDTESAYGWLCFSLITGNLFIHALTLVTRTWQRRSSMVAKYPVKSLLLPGAFVS